MWFAKDGRGQIWLQKCHTSREEALLSRLLVILKPGFSREFFHPTEPQ